MFILCLINDTPPIKSDILLATSDTEFVTDEYLYILLMKCNCLAFLLLISLFSFAQDSSFRLKDYKYRTPGFRALSFNLNLSGSVADSKPLFGTDRSGKSFSVAPSSIWYTKIISTDKQLHQSTFSILPLISSAKYASGNDESKNSTLRTSFRWQRNDRFYKNGLWFIELGNSLEASNNGHSRLEPSSINKNNERKIENTVTLGVGRGRIERVQDAQMALYILEDLKAQGLLDAELTPTLTNSFATLITDINNRRVFDSRRRRIYELTRIDSFLRSGGVVNKTDIRHFTTINDNWAFAINPFRLAGTAWFGRMKPGAAYSQNFFQSKSVSNTETDIKSFLLSLAPEVGFEKYVPVTLEWQQNMGASIAYQWQRVTENLKKVSSAGTSESKSTINGGHVDVTGFWGVGYFPNTRTQLGTNLVANGILYKKGAYQFSPELDLFANYFIGYRTYLSANGNIKYWKIHYNSSQSNRHFSASFRLNFSHILF